MKEARRKIAADLELIVRGEDVKQADAVLAEVLLQMAAEAGGSLSFNPADLEFMEEVARRLRTKGVDPDTGQWLC